MSESIRWDVMAKTRTGGMLHKAMHGCSKTNCGCKVVGEVSIREGQTARNLCDKCFGSKTEMNYQEYTEYSHKKLWVWGKDGSLTVTPMVKA